MRPASTAPNYVYNYGKKNKGANNKIKNKRNDNANANANAFQPILLKKPKQRVNGALHPAAVYNPAKVLNNTTTQRQDVLRKAVVLEQAMKKAKEDGAVVGTRRIKYSQFLAAVKQDSVAGYWCWF